MSAPARTLALFDVENLLPGGPAGATSTDYVEAVQRAADTAGLEPTTDLVLGLGSKNTRGIFAVTATWPGAALRCLAGRDGGELALLHHASDIDAVERTYDRVVIGSGDGEFTSYAAQLSARGLHTMVVAWRPQLSNRLRLAAAETRLLAANRFVEHQQLRAA